MIEENVPGSEYVNVPATTLAADGQFLQEQQILNKAKSLIYRAGTRRPAIAQTEGQNLEPR
jgi:hypothetical protein